MVHSIEDYPRSSYHYVVGKAAAPQWVLTDDLLAHFDSTCRFSALEQFTQFVNETETLEIWECLRHQNILGDEVFAQQYLPSPDEQQKLTEVPKDQKRPAPKPFVYYQQSCAHRNNAILSAHQSGGYTMIQIANYFKVHYSTVSRIVARFKT
jgi:putative transposase